MALSSALNARRPAAEDSTAFGPIAERFRRAGDLDRAVSLCRDGLRKFPQHISARVTLGWALLDLNQYDEARTELEQVLRRAPDNLAAIRGLAELHDRSEHTLHLPMDGPGQWPPDEMAVDKAAATSKEPAVWLFPTVDSTDEPVLLTGGEDTEPAPDFLQAGPAVLTPAELGSAVWSSTPPAEPAPTAAAPAATPVVETASTLVSESAAALAAEAIAPPMAESAAMPIAEPVAPPTAAVEPLPAPLPETWPDPAVEPEGVEWPVVSEADIAALIAEADALEAAAVFDAAEPAAVLDSAMGVVWLDDVALDGPAGPTVLAAVDTAEPVFDIAQPVFDTAQPVFETAEPVFDTAKPVFETAEPVFATAEPVFETAEPVFATAEPVFETAEPVFATAEPVLETAEPVFATAEPVLETAEPVLDTAEPVGTESPALALQGVEHEHIAEVVPVAMFADPRPVRSPVTALERFLAKVQARRQQPMAESVA